MKKIVIILAFLAFQLVACHQKQSDVKPKPTVSASTTEVLPSIQVKHSFLFGKYKAEKLQVADFVEHYLNAMYDSSLDYRNNQWDSKILIDQQDYFLRDPFEKGFLVYNSPQILGIRKLPETKYEVKLAIEQDGFVYKIMNLVVAFDGLHRPYFIDQLGENLTAFERIKVGNIEFYYSPKVSKNDTLEHKMIAFNQKTAELFEETEKMIKVIALNDLKDYSAVLGFDYMPFLTYDGQTGGIAMPAENILFSANNSPYYPHELVHLYTGDFDAHNWFDEGCATYLGGSVEYPLEHHLKKVADQMDSLDFSGLPTNTKLDDDTSLKYALGGLFCKLAMEEYGGKKSLFKLLNSGKTEEDFHTALTAVFRIKQQDYDSFIRDKLTTFK